MEKEITFLEELSSLIELKDSEGIHQLMESLKTEDLIYAYNRLSKDEQVSLIGLLSPEDAAMLLERIPQNQAIEAIENAQIETAASILNELYSDDQVDILAELETEEAEAILEEMRPQEAENVRKLIQYDSESAGGLMVTEYLAYDSAMTVAQTVKDLQEKAEEYEDYHVQYIYVTSDNRFVGVLQMRDLLLSRPNTKLDTIAIKNAKTMLPNARLEELIGFFDKYDFFGVPVVSETEELLGIVLRKDLREAETERSNLELLETQGIVGGEELRSMPVWLRSKRRLSWLSVNIVLNIIAASVIAFYQDTLEEVIALAVFLPVISDMSGCSGNQAVAVSLRELSLGLVKPYELARVLWQEIKVGLINGLVLGLLIGLAAFIYMGNFYLGLVVGGALAINTIVAVSIGGTIPLFLKKMNTDPALASGPILTTVTDMLGFFLALTFAGAAMSYLV
ncbi:MULTISPECIES: magnesium transporter [Roseivirga]|jgi:magnesium transporter|uniref:magnesium transporter n=1 Tax=Roseivirga TaxID=290180 RepID=UPI00257D3A8C|nr:MULTISPECIES: magnesium transporter [Roseivirga]|tara:strand:- start:15971 stop:17326 length:1356 start_codon:yes stop_codon:yes gene_type:complete